MQPFKKLAHSDWAKSIVITGPVTIAVDYDDVEHPAVDAAIPMILDILNQHWDQEKFEQETARITKEQYGEDA